MHKTKNRSNFQSSLHAPTSPATPSSIPRAISVLNYPLHFLAHSETKMPTKSANTLSFQPINITPNAIRSAHLTQCNFKTRRHSFSIRTRKTVPEVIKDAFPQSLRPLSPENSIRYNNGRPALAHFHKSPPPAAATRALYDFTP